LFNMIHQNNLVYNTCWEDPRLDRQALDLGPDDTVLVITSAGCNALDYALTGTKHVHAVDMNPRQNALLDLKLAGIRNLSFPDFFAMFGQGRLEGVRSLYRTQLRADLSDWSRGYWDKRIRFFDKTRYRPFYFRGTSGTFAKLVNMYIDRIVKLRPAVNAILEAKSVDEQRDIYENQIRDRFWTKSLRFAMSRDMTMAMVGVPRAQRDHLEKTFEGGLIGFIENCLESVFARLPLEDNYFWRVYLTGSYTRECCPEYLKEENFQRLKDGLADNVTTHTDSVEGFLRKHDGTISRFVLLDHMDWLSGDLRPLLISEWQAILDRAADNTRIIWRSGGMKTDFINTIEVNVNGQRCRVGELLSYDPETAEELHEVDRVHTYGSFHIADVAA